MSYTTKAMADKVLILGVDGFEPSLAKQFMDEGRMPSLKKYVERGSARENLVLLGAHPTVTPPMWTTLATGAYPATHGIISFFNPHPEKAGTSVYALDSRMCLAEPFWNVAAEAGRNTLVWHWPGSSWPPTSDSPNLTVVDGTQPGAINMGAAVVDKESILLADETVANVRFVAYDAPNNPGVGCVITDLEAADESAAIKEEGKIGKNALENIAAGGIESSNIVVDESDTEIEALGGNHMNTINSPIREATAWADAPIGAKEFTLLTSKGYVRRPCLILQNEAGVYDTVAIYRSKKEIKPVYVLKKDVYAADYIDDVKVDEKDVKTNRCLRILELAEDGSRIRLWMSPAYAMDRDNVFHPKSLYQEIMDHVGPVPPISSATGRVPEFVEKLVVPSWEVYCQWQADALHYMMDQKGSEVIFSHLHNIDLIGHQIWHLAKHREEWGNDEVFYQGMITEIYEQTDRYLGRFLHYLDEGWTIIVTSDHGLITEENKTVGLGELRVNGNVMVELGYTALKKDENGNVLHEIDWEHTTAVAKLGGQVTINLKGRYATGIVDPADKYDLETKIINDLYNYRDPITGQRVVSIALRNKDAIILGLTGERCGDVIYFMEEGHNIIHADSLSTQKGYFNTSVSPIFVAAGKGIKAGYTTERVIRQVDVVPTVAALLGLRMPAQCEGAPAYQIFED